MSYKKQNFTTGQTLNAEHLNNIEAGIVANETAIEGKQPKGNYLTQHQKIKTINGQSLVGEGNIEIEGNMESESDTRGACRYSLKDGEYNILSVNHRGYSKEAPENTIPAYILSKQKGYNYVECDVSFTADGVAVLLHDSTIDRTSDGSGNISDLTYEQVSQYDFGSWFSTKYEGTRIPTFNEFIVYCKGLGLHPYIELKSNGGYTQEQIGQIVNEVESCGMKGKVTYISFSSTFLEYVKEYDPQARLGFISDINRSTIETAVALKTGENEVFMDTNYTYITEAKVSLCMENDLPLEVWTVNQASVIKGLNPYISGVTSDNQNAGRLLYEKYSTYEYSEDTGGDTGGDTGEDTGGDTGTTTYTITNNLTNATNSNSSTSVEKGASYNASISAADGYTISSVGVTMGGEDITSSAYVEGVISIDSVSGNIVITVVASNGEYEVVRTIAQDELAVGIQIASNGSPYYNDNKSRTSYLDFDLTYEAGYTYKFEFVTGNGQECSIGTQWYNQTAKNKQENNASIGTSNVHDPGWLTNGAEVTPPETYNGSAIVGYRFTFKRNSNSTMENGDIVSVVISRKLTA